MRIAPTALILCLFAASSHAQMLHRPVAANYTGTGAYSLNHTDVFSFTANQASLAQLKNAAIGIFGERRFFLSELNFFNAVVALPTSTGNFGLNTKYYGFSDYNETQLGLAYGRKLGEKLDIGAQFNYNAIRISSYGSASAISFEAGVVLHLTEKVHTGVHAFNPVGGKFGKDLQEELPSVYTIGLGYDASEKFYVSTEFIKEENRDVNVNATMQYRILPQLHARAGLSAADGITWIGVGFQKNSFRADVCSSYHPQLGLSPGLLFVFNFSQKQK
jgi:hypothetical protein